MIINTTRSQNDFTFLMDIAATNRHEMRNDALCFRIQKKFLPVTIPLCPRFTENSPFNRFPVIQIKSIKVLTTKSKYRWASSFDQRQSLRKRGQDHGCALRTQRVVAAAGRAIIGSGNRCYARPFQKLTKKT
jgi:hypothetical protein